MAKRNNHPTDIAHIAAEIRSLESDLGTFRKGIQKIKNAPHEKGAHIVGNQHAEFVAELEEIARQLEELPRKWETE